MKSMYDNEMELSFLSKSNNEAFARITVAAFVAQLDPTIEELADIKTAVSEAVTNSIIHGYEDTEGIVKIKAKLMNNIMEVEISDSGKGIEDIELARKPLYTTKGNMERSGMGFTIMESFMDSVQIHSVVGIGTRIVMKKKIKKNEDEEELELSNMSNTYEQNEKTKEKMDIRNENRLNEENELQIEKEKNALIN